MRGAPPVLTLRRAMLVDPHGNSPWKDVVTLVGFIVNDTGFLYTAHEIKNCLRLGESDLSDGISGAGQAGEIAGHFVQARLAAVSLGAYPGSVPADLASAYACQDTAIDRWPDQIAGWKVARILPARQAQYPEERLIGPVFRRNVHAVAAGQVAVCPIFEGGFAAVEAEVGIYVRADAPAGKSNWTADEAAELVADMRIGVEIASSPLATLNDLGPGAVISDFGNNWGVIAGAIVPDWRTRSQELAVETFIDDKSVGRGTIAIPQTPLASFAFALSKAAQRGRPLRAGQYISTGMITGVHDIRIGEHSRFTFGQYGEILCRIVRARAYANE